MYWKVYKSFWYILAFFGGKMLLILKSMWHHGSEWSMMDPCREMIRLRKATFLLFHPQTLLQSILESVWKKSYTHCQIRLETNIKTFWVWVLRLDLMLSDDAIFFSIQIGCAPRFFVEAQNIWIFLEGWITYVT